MSEHRVGPVARVSAAVVTVAMLALGGLVSSGLLVPLIVTALLVALLVVLSRRRGPANENKGKTI